MYLATTLDFPTCLSPTKMMSYIQQYVHALYHMNNCRVGLHGNLDWVNTVESCYMSKQVFVKISVKSKLYRSCFSVNVFVFKDVSNFWFIKVSFQSLIYISSTFRILALIYHEFMDKHIIYLYFAFQNFDYEHIYLIKVIPEMHAFAINLKSKFFLLQYTKTSWL